jgi:hypothetical protein
VTADNRRIFAESLADLIARCTNHEPCELVILLVARGGIEPPTFRFSGGRSYRLSYLAGRHRCVPGRDCDPDGTRTRDLRRDRAAR